MLQGKMLPTSEFFKRIFQISKLIFVGPFVVDTVHGGFELNLNKVEKETLVFLIFFDEDVAS